MSAILWFPAQWEVKKRKKRSKRDDVQFTTAQAFFLFEMGAGQQEEPWAWEIILSSGRKDREARRSFKRIKMQRGRKWSDDSGAMG